MLLSHSAQYFIAAVFSAIFGFANAFIFTRLLEPSEFGIYVSAMSVAGILSAVAFTWIRLGITRFQAQGDIDVRVTAFVGLLGSSIATPFIGLILYQFGLSGFVVASAVIIALSRGILEFGQEIFRAELKTTKFMAMSNFRAVSAFLVAYMVVASGLGGYGLIAAAAATNFATALVWSRSIWHRPVASFDKLIFFELLVFGLPSTLTGLALAVNSSLDRLFVVSLLGDGAAGQYGAVADFVRQSLVFPMSAISSAVLPLAVRRLSEAGPEAARKILMDGGELLFAMLIPAIVGMATVSPNLCNLVFGSSFRETAMMLMPILAAIWLFNGTTQGYIHLSFYLGKKPTYLFYQGALIMTLNAILIYPFLQLAGLKGVAISTLVSEIGGVAAGVALSRRAFPLPIPAFAIGRILVATALMTLAIISVGGLPITTGLPALAMQVTAGLIVYSIAAITFDICGIRRKFVVVLTERWL